jgi:flagellar basal-body rod protein FlgB
MVSKPFGEDINMAPESLFSSTTVMLERMLDFQAQRHTVLSTNIANVDTPGYKGHDLRFSDELKKAIDSPGTLSLRKTNEQHLPVAINEMKEIEHRPVPGTDAVQRLDGNTVDLDKEMTRLSENSLYYNVTAQLVSKKLRGLKTAISEVR